jgi:hypothetical protein
MRYGENIIIKIYITLSFFLTVGFIYLYICLFTMLDRCSRVRFSAGAGNFSFHHRVQNGSGAHPASYPMVLGDLSLGVKRPGREAVHSPPSSDEVKE